MKKPIWNRIIENLIIANLSTSCRQNCNTVDNKLLALKSKLWAKWIKNFIDIFITSDQKISFLIHFMACWICTVDLEHRERAIEKIYSKNDLLCSYFEIGH